ncbi:MAG: helix-turn-helix transcriptional regulator [Clostridia bacterium]|nr:helix-turn-helix transcriptional regulator [Clostridia bacterium]
MDYFKIGERIRKTRKAHDISQELLAEKVDISTTHMSHIETGNTKLSLSVIADIAVSLNVSIDYLVFGEERDENRYYGKIEEILSTCSPDNARIILGTVDFLNKLLRAQTDKYEPLP